VVTAIVLLPPSRTIPRARAREAGSEVKLAGGSPPLGTPAVQGYVLRLDANTWKPTAGTGLPNEYVYGFVAISAQGTEIPHGLMAATDDAVYLSRDEGQTWQRASSGLPRRAHCGDLRFVVDSLGGQPLNVGGAPTSRMIVFS
jgi:hypothetical protein